MLRHWAKAHPDVSVVAVSHGDERITSEWLDRIDGLGRIHLIQDPGRHLYAQWGLGYSGFAHFAGPWSLLGVMRLWLQGIRNRDASGTRWQRAGTFLVESGHITWANVPSSAQCFLLPSLQPST